MKKIIKFILVKISRIIYWIIPLEFKKYPIGTPNTRIPLLNLLDEDKTKTSYEFFKKSFKSAVLFHDAELIRKYAIETSLINDDEKKYFYLEFGVFKGDTANFFSRYVKKLYAFDSFEGLKEDWLGNIDNSKGKFNLNKQVPKLNPNVEPVVGWVQDTLDDFLKKHNPKINFIHIDLDTYPSTKYVLEKIKPYLIKNSIIIFDELYNFINWEEGEFKALREVFNENEYCYKSFNLGDQQAVIQIKQNS